MIGPGDSTTKYG